MTTKTKFILSSSFILAVLLLAIPFLFAEATPTAILENFVISPQVYYLGSTVNGSATLRVTSPVTASFRITLYKDEQLFWSRDIDNIHLSPEGPAGQRYIVPLETILGFRPTLPDNPSLFGNWEMVIARKPTSSFSSESLSQTFSIAAESPGAPGATAIPTPDVFVGRMYFALDSRIYRLGETLRGQGTLDTRESWSPPTSVSFLIELNRVDPDWIKKGLSSPIIYPPVWRRETPGIVFSPGVIIPFTVNDVFGFIPTIPQDNFFVGHWKLSIRGIGSRFNSVADFRIDP